MSSEWVEKTWGELATLEYGKALKGYEQSSGKYCVYGTNGPIGWTDSYLYNKPSVIIGRKGAYRGVHFAEKPFFVIDTAFYLKPKIEFDMRWAYYQLLTQNINAIDSGSAIPSTSREDFYGLPLLFPPISEQAAIAQLLGALEQKIALNYRMNDTLKGIAQTLFKSWFVDFDPVKAKAEGRKPDGMDDATATLFPSNLTDSPSGHIPEGWNAETLKRVSFLNSESWSRNNPPDQIEYIDLANTKWGTIESTQIFSWKDAPSRAQRILRKGDTIVGTVRPGNGSYSFISSDGLTGSTGFAVLRPKEVYYREFVYLSATSTENIARLAHLADGAAYPAVRPDVVYATPILFPGDEILLRFSQCLSPIMEKVEINKKENKILGDIRDLLLPHLISGKLRIVDDTL